MYINRMIPGLYINGLVDSNRRLLNTMEYQTAPMAIQLISLPFHILGCYLLTDYWGLGIKGTAIASSITSLFNFVALWIFTSRFTNDKLK